MVGYQHPEAETIAMLQDEVNQRRAAVETTSQDRSKALDDSVKLHQYVRDTEESLDWMREKDALVHDVDWDDRSNLKSKLQAHAVVHQDIQAYNPTISELQATCAKLQAENPPGALRLAGQQALVSLPYCHPCSS